MKVNRLLILSECAGAWMNIESAKQLFHKKHRNKALKSLKEAQKSLEFIQWHLDNYKKVIKS